LKANLSPPEIVVDECIGCGECVSVCPSFVIDLVAEKAGVTRGNWCIGCGHCSAVCPTGAVIFGKDSPERSETPGPGPATSPEILELLLRERRSVRNYTREPVPHEILERVLKAGSYAPTGTNSQNVHYIVLRSPDQISQLRKMTIDFYEKIFSRARTPLGRFFLSWIAGPRTVEYLRESLPKVDHAFEQVQDGRDPLFYHAPVLILAHAESWDVCSSFNCSVALYHCSLLAHTLGLGCCFNGFLASAVNHDRRLKKWLAIPSGHRCYSAMTLGYQNVRYRRLVRRDPPRIDWR
jgi:nitroreductase/NAD-dependent dihydropyrimidine dehydrogenase PreA subunit